MHCMPDKKKNPQKWEIQLYAFFRFELDSHHAIYAYIVLFSALFSPSDEVP